MISAYIKFPDTLNRIILEVTMVITKKNTTLKLFVATLALGAVFITTNKALADAADEMVNPTDKVLVGYWHNWNSAGSDGYQRGTSANFNLSETQDGYNVINVSFMKTPQGQSLPTFTPHNKTDAEFRSEVAQLNSEGKSVLIALGGADAHIELTQHQEDDFVNEIIRLVETYGFDGLDIDLEQSAIEAADNQTVIPSALRRVKDHYRAQGKNFMITMAPEFPYLTTNGKYAPYIKGLEGYYDFINPQYYNQGGDGFWDNNLNMWVSQSNDDLKEEFLYGLTERLVTGSDGFIQIPADKFVIGLPSNEDAAATGYVKDASDVQNALQRLKNSGNEIKGLMTWSVNWDAGKNSSGVSYGNSFVNTYAPMLFDNNSGEPQEKPTLPQISVTNITQNSAQITANSSSDLGIAHYEIKIGSQTESTSTGSYTATNLQSNTNYTVQVVAVDRSGNRSNPATTTFTTTSNPTNPTDTWDKDATYWEGDRVIYNGKEYEAKWWNTNSRPDESGEYGPWREL